VLVKQIFAVHAHVEHSGHLVFTKELELANVEEMDMWVNESGRRTPPPQSTSRAPVATAPISPPSMTTVEGSRIRWLSKAQTLVSV
jgi:hypothetical protein